MPSERAISVDTWQRRNHFAAPELTDPRKASRGVSTRQTGVFAPQGRPLGLDDPAMEGRYGGLRPITHVQATEHDVHMPLHRAFRDSQVRGDLLVAQTLHDQPQNIEFPRTQLGPRHPLRETLQNWRGEIANR